EMQLACEAAHAAVQDAGLSGADIDGMATFSMDNNWEIEVHRQVGGRELRFFARTEYGGGGALGPFAHAVSAIRSGQARNVVVYRGMNERSGLRFGSGEIMSMNALNPDMIHFSHYFPTGFMTPASWIAMCARRYMHEYGATSEDFGRIAVSMRDFAATNPAAFFYEKPLTLEQHQASRMIADPLRLFDCCQESDGAVAFVLTSPERAADLPHAEVEIAAVRQCALPSSRQVTPFYHDDIARFPEFDVMAADLYQSAGIDQQEIDFACLYDHFTPSILPQLESFGFCGRGEAADFVKDGHISRGGRLPVNTNGGQIGEAYIHGLNGVAEVVKQMRGDSVNQLDRVNHAVVTAGAGVPTGAAILRKTV
ncbi:MAG: lipid-transfer protein, partial [Gammaproteobacteria bacterium]|nr:lipid-transfer protein [Gammaproteobacteria bacterium]